MEPLAIKVAVTEDPFGHPPEYACTRTAVQNYSTVAAVCRCLRCIVLWSSSHASVISVNPSSFGRLIGAVHR